MSGVFTKKGFDDACEASEGSLPLKLQQIAEEELGETPAKRQEALDRLRKLLDVEPDLNANQDAEFLLRFLRVRKYNVESALQTIKNYYRNRAASGSLYREFLPCKAPPAARKIVMILPHKDVHGRPVLLMKPGSWMPDEVSYSDLHRAGLFCLEHLARDPAAQVLGIVLLVDYGGFTVDKLFSTSIGLIRRGLEYLQDCMPMRLKAAHNVRQSYAFDVFFALVRPFIKAKLAERIRLHGQNFESLHEEISPKALPEEYGGQGPPLDPEECWKTVDADEDYFAACSRFGYATSDQDNDLAEGPEPPLELTYL
ncbi:alpha-tocopherol transfer protein-like [Dermacentor silvarum]|uniref:alpha-tocopherol transfer protein-like n=1 Tax=Dermacentor silvarum TaxID=543639 RepID=UPI00189A2711|nr:alpha-tocopherol transfer protein-like [Dermacentor silvarum]